MGMNALPIYSGHYERLELRYDEAQLSRNVSGRRYKAVTIYPMLNHKIQFVLLGPTCGTPFLHLSDIHFGQEKNGTLVKHYRFDYRAVKLASYHPARPSNDDEEYSLLLSLTIETRTLKSFFGINAKVGEGYESPKLAELCTEEASCIRRFRNVKRKSR
jgi:hypothetical protein